MNSDQAAADRYYARYVDYVSGHLPRGASLLEVGSGTGMSASRFARAGYRMTAFDVCDAFFDRRLAGSLRFVGGDALRLPFRSASFDGVASYQTLEHVADPARALSEMMRVLRPGGLLFVVGPNLISPLGSFFVLGYSIPRTRPLRYWFRREPAFPRFPLGATYPEAVYILLRNLALLGRKHVRADAEFTTREADFTEPAHADSDSCYLLNPVDIVKYLRPRGFSIVSSTGRGRFGRLGSLAGGTWVAARKGGP